MPRIKIEIPKHGPVRMAGEGYHGPACDMPMQRLAEKLGTVTHREETPEYFELESTLEQEQ